MQRLILEGGNDDISAVIMGLPETIYLRKFIISLRSQEGFKYKIHLSHNSHTRDTILR
ncbi:MAG TPA: hypothetical protein VE971_06140 [Candidatus Eisenbacteria bacterium]|nr:hypothetical protein [Candidatus Eisenbacteria bacterium]